MAPGPSTLVDDQRNRETIGRYSILRQIGSGGMGDVFAASDPQLQRPVAIKVLRPELAEKPELVERFEREARAIAALEHPNIVSIHSVEAADGVRFLTMELVEGESLADRIGKGRLPVRTLLTLGIQMADAVAAAHERGITHRDLKPGNVMVSNDGRIKILDFGLAKKVVEEPEDSRRTSDNALTSEGVVIGTVSYMSPEQAEGRSIDHRTDIFALGVILYEMATGELPFRGNSRIGILSSILNDTPVSVTQHNPALPRHLDRIIQLALEKDRERRLQSAKDLRNELDQLLREITTAHAPDAPTKHQRMTTRSGPLVGASVAGLVVGAALTAWLLEDVDPSVEIGRISRVTGAPGLEVHPKVSPNGQIVVYVAGPHGARRLVSRSVAGGQEISLAEELDGDKLTPAWIDDTQVAFMCQGKCWVVSPLGGRLRVLAGVDAGTGMTFSPDGEIVTYGEDGRLVSHRLSDNERTVVAEMPEISAPDWSPDGTRIAFVSGNPQFAFSNQQIGNLGESSIWTVAAGGGDSVLVIEGRLNANPVWRGSDQLLFVSNRDGTRDIYSIEIGRDGRSTGAPRRVTTGLDVHTFSLSADGTMVAFSEFRSRANIWSLPIPSADTPISTREAEPITRGNQSIEGVGISPDGELLLFDSNAAGNQDIYRLELSSGMLRQLTTHPRDDFLAEFSPDGDEIAFYSFRTGNRDLHIMAADGSGIEQITNDPAQDRYPHWSPDGNRLAFYSDRSGQQEIWVITRSAKGDQWGPPQQWTFAGGQYGRWSRDGRTLLFATPNQLWTVSATGETPHPLLPQTHRQDDWPFPNWSQDGEVVYFKGTAEDGRDRIWSVPASGGEPEPLVVFEALSVRNEFATDGRRFYFTITEEECDIFTLQMR